MTRLYFLSFTLWLVLFSCGQNQASNQTRNTNKLVSSNDTNLSKPILADTGKIAVLPIDTSNTWLFKNAIALQLTNQDLQTIDMLLTDCINANNKKQNTTKRFSEYINLKIYKRQYVPFITSKGEKKVYVNCFCSSGYANEFDYWKSRLVEVDDGGSCFFHVILNLTLKQYEQLYTNGYA